MPGKTQRKRNRTVNVYLDGDEYLMILAQADRAGVSMSTYLRNLAKADHTAYRRANPLPDLTTNKERSK